jgi:hypothetical protein
MDIFDDPNWKKEQPANKQFVIEIDESREFDDDNVPENFFECPSCKNNSVHMSAKFCSECGVKIVWTKKFVDPRSRIICDFCGRNAIDEPTIFEKRCGRICIDCVLECYDTWNKEAE